MRELAGKEARKRSLYEALLRREGDDEGDLVGDVQNEKALH
jgi:hypothetical protein